VITHQELIKEVTQELAENEDVQALILYGSVSRHEEYENSDIDLILITKEYHLQKRHEIRHGITIEYVDIHLDFIRNFLSKYEIPIIFALANGILLFDKIIETKELITEAKKIIEEGPPKNERWESEEYRVYRRSELTELYKDLLDLNDIVTFNYMSSILVESVIPILLESNNLWNQPRKKMLGYLKSHCNEGYKYIEILLDSISTLEKKRKAAENLTEFALAPYGGILRGDNLIFRKTQIK